MKQVSLLEVNRLLPQFRDAVAGVRGHLHLLKTASAALDSEQQTERDDKEDNDGTGAHDRAAEAAKGDQSGRHGCQR